uniref:Uncharacterized protein n=1 Tax=Arundo donax TaxID=35708 RepID=A0A0A9HCA3_ARUDO
MELHLGGVNKQVFLQSSLCSQEGQS